ncbi:MAG: hypothetical protein CMA93_04920 [Euryarchaeota archaeon]|nr:hypothetical protein [Euryarchaeota archaeon]
MNGTVRDLLAARGIVLTPTDAPHSHGFTCLGVAERVPEVSQDSTSQVFVWHVPDDLFPVTTSEVERWVVDAPSGKHWILSERDFDSSLIPDSRSIEAVVWGPKRMASWIGESVLSGDLGTFLNSNDESELETKAPFQKQEEIHSQLTLKPLVELSNWLEQRGWDGVRTSPILLSARLWTITGNLIGPDGQAESGKWQIIEDPWAESFHIHDGEQILDKSPALRVIPPPSGWMAAIDGLPEKMLNLADQRRQGNPETNDDEVSSIMLEWWRLDQSSAKGDYSQLTIPGWMVYPDGAEARLLHGRNGRVYGMR